MGGDDLAANCAFFGKDREIFFVSSLRRSGPDMFKWIRRRRLTDEIRNSGTMNGRESFS